MRHFFTAVIEKNATFEDDFTTEPYECAWASEARWFIQVADLDGKAELEARVQVSPDGLFWCDHGAGFPTISGTGLYTLPLRDFGGWLRLNCSLSGQNPRARVMIYLVLKE
ncbi:MAG TPA: hypothetical protein DGO43_02695 [Chloroflexi bacterium]|nr:hypothetical protein [Chloroflexota bacterium]|tara:strand:- start:2836 stop:3168 length:333 start_codon:yes stop_codon:yes gene_type:complete